MDLTELELEGLFPPCLSPRGLYLEAGLALWQSVWSHTCNGLWWGFVVSFGRKNQI